MNDRSSRRFWMTLALMLSLALGGLLYLSGAHANADRQHEYQMNGLYQSNALMWSRGIECEMWNIYLDGENKTLKAELAKIHGKHHKPL